MVPLHFNCTKFKWARKIEDKVTVICKQRKAEFRLIDLTLQVHNRIEKLFRPYTDDQFEGYIEPYFKEVKGRDIFFGVAWGCLNPERKKIREKPLRGFLIKKQGFAIGERADVGKYFGRTTFFDRYIGEIIVVHPDLLPNAARSDFEFSPLRTLFYEAVSNMAISYNNRANQYQEYTKGDEQLDDAIEKIKQSYAHTSYYADRPEQLIEMIVEIRKSFLKLKGGSKEIQSGLKELAMQKTSLKVQEHLKEIQQLINQKSNKPKTLKFKKLPELRLFEKMKKLPHVKAAEAEKEPENLLEVVESLDLPMNEQLKIVLELIDERYIQATSVSKEEYIDNLKKLKTEIEDLFNEE